MHIGYGLNNFLLCFFEIKTNKNLTNSLFGYLLK